MGRTNERGVTLVELLVVLVVIAVLLAIGVGPWASLAARTKTTVVTNDLAHAVTAARSLAVTGSRGAATICPVDGDECDSAGEWNNGWMLFQDLNYSGDRQPEEPIKQHWHKPSQPLRVTATRPIITFTREGYLTNDEGVIIMICDSSGKNPPRSVRVWGLGTHTLHNPPTCDLPAGG